MIERSAITSVTARARHEAAHAVVAVRLGLPLVVVDIRPSSMNQAFDGSVMPGGFTELEGPVVRRWRDDPRNPEAVTGPTALATYTAAGCVADGVSGVGPRDFGQRLDLGQIAEFARDLGVGSGDIFDPATRPFIKARVEAAHTILTADEGAAWDRVRFELARKKVLTGQLVTELVKQSDEKNAP